MASIGSRLICTLRALTHLPAPPQRLLTVKRTSSLPHSASLSSSTSTTSSSKNDEPKIESLEDLENLLNTPAYGNRGEEFNKALQLEYDFFKYNGQLVPNVMTEEMWGEIRGLKTVEDRLELYRFLQLKERYKTKHAGRTKKGEYAEKRRRALLGQLMGGMDKVPECIYDQNGYSLLGPTVSICRKIDDVMVKKHHNLHLTHALNFGQPLVFDFGVDYQMNNFEASCFIAQMKEMYGSNRAHWEPFNLYLCNYNPRIVVQRKLVESSHTEKWLWNVTRRCFTDVFPKEKIVYLSSRSRVPLTEFSHDSIYVIGACVDSRPGKDEMSKVKELGLRHAYFDVRPYFAKKGIASIPLNQVFRSLMDQRDTPNLPYAYRHFSRRRFHYRERAMNRILVDHEQLFVNKRAIRLPRIHDVRNYELMPERTYPDDDDDEDNDDDEEVARRIRQRYSRGGPRHDRFHDDGDDYMDRRMRRRNGSRSSGMNMSERDHQRRRYEDILDEDDDDDHFEVDPATPKRNSIKDY